jgi:hypothetical protein
MHNWDFQTSRNGPKKVTVEEKESHSFYPCQPIASKQNYLDVTALIRSLQRAEGEDDCFRTMNLNCQYIECRWREYCFEKS